MIHKDHVQLLQKGIGEVSKKVKKKQLWADFGSGEGAFTLALADILGSSSTIYSVDKNEDSLFTQKEAFKNYFPEHHIEYICQNFTKQLSFPPLDGIVAANSLHFLKNKIPVLQLLREYLKPQGNYSLLSIMSIKEICGFLILFHMKLSVNLPKKPDLKILIFSRQFPHISYNKCIVQ